jgi:tetratricopeptide (TPR) repeat protein
MRVALLAVIFGCCVGLSAQNSPSSSTVPSPTAAPSTTQSSATSSANTPSANSSSPNPQKQDSASTPDSSSAVKPSYKPNLEPPRSDRVNAASIEDGESSSKDTQIDLSPPAEDSKLHPHSSDILMDEGSGTTDTSEFRYWNPHKAAKDVEVGDFYFKRKNYKAAEDRYREALLYKANDAIATFHLAQCLDKMQRPEEAQEEYEAYLKILPNGQESEQAKKALARLKGSK